MSRVWSSTLETMLGGHAITPCFLIELDNGITDPVRLTNIDKNITEFYPPFLYSPGFDLTRIMTTNGGEPMGLDIILPFDSDGPIYAEHVYRGLWRGAVVNLWICDFENPLNHEIIFDGEVGLQEFTDQLQGRLQLLSQADAFSDIVLPRIQQKCWYEFGGAACGVDLGPHTYAGTVTSVTNRSKFTLSHAAPSSADFNFGSVRFTLGANAGTKKIWIRKWTSGTGLVELVDPFPFDIEVGDEVQFHTGCPQDRAGCKSYDNLVRFPGMEFVLG